MSDNPETETLAGYVVDIACLRKYPREFLTQRAREHSRKCLMMGHCVESGYGLVSEDGMLSLLDTAATPQVIAAVNTSGADRGIWLETVRTSRDGEMVASGVSVRQPPAVS